MSGIAGFQGMEITGPHLEAMAQSMTRRCPEGAVFRKIGKGGFLQGRAEDLSFYRITEGKRSWDLAFSGRLLNRVELRSALEAQGQRFRSETVGETVLRAWIQWGRDCLAKLDGPFAFALWEESRRQLFLARDPMGMEPLFYRICGDGLIFASEIKTILAAPGIRAQLDGEGAAQILLLGPGRVPGSGVFRDIRELEPGCWASLRGGLLTLGRYWKLRDREHRESFQETSDHVRQLVLESIDRNLEGNPGAFLSGGLDSSLITAVAASRLRDRGQVLHTFSVDYQNNSLYFTPGKFQPEADEDYIREMTAYAGTSHHRTILAPEDLLRQLEEATRARDLPGMGDVDFSLMAFCRDIGDRVPAALSGECADEIFGGYPWYRDPELRDRDGFPWAQNTLQRSRLMVHRREDARDYVMDLYRKTCRESDILPDAEPEDRRIRELVNLNLRWFMQNLLERNDRMRGALEIRVPFCDRRIAEYLYGIPWSMKDWQGREKGLLRHSAEGLLPDRVRLRKKSPYPKTFDPQYESLVTARLRRILSEDRPIWYLADRTAVRELLNREQDRPWYGQLMRRPQTIAWLLQIDCWLELYQIELCF